MSMTLDTSQVLEALFRCTDWYQIWSAWAGTARPSPAIAVISEAAQATARFIEFNPQLGLISARLSCPPTARRDENIRSGAFLQPRDAVKLLAQALS
jgi:hypothetical protein